MLSNFILPSLRELVGGFFHLLYPDLCVACQKDLPLRDSCFCLRCRMKCIPFELDSPRQNEMIARLWGRLPVEWAVSGYHFARKSPIQRALHQLKYHNKPDIGQMLGRELGRRLIEIPRLARVDAIVPVPLHPKKERIRGYNQSAEFARGLSEIMQTPVLHGALVRHAFTASQTRKKRMERFDNLENVFAVSKTRQLEGKHVLLADDVLTTGATLEMCGLALLSVPGVRLSIATIAVADR